MPPPSGPGKEEKNLSNFSAAWQFICMELKPNVALNEAGVRCVLYIPLSLQYKEKSWIIERAL